MANGKVNSGCGWCIPMRYIMAIMGSIAMAIIYGFKVNISVAIVAMVNHTAIKLENQRIFVAPKTNAVDESVCHHSDLSQWSRTQDGPFVWNEPLQGLILSSYFWGYLVSLIPGGRMSELLSAKWVMFGSVVLNVVGSLLTPLAATLHYSFFIAIRVIQGLGGGVSFPAMHVMVAKWAPPNERSILASIIYAGTALGTVISLLLSGLIAANLDWRWVFYIEGLLCLVWTLGWLIVADSPEEQNVFISDYEKDYIMESLGQTRGHPKTTKLSVPWKHVLQSPPFYAILVAHFCSNFGWYMLLIELPTFMNQILKFDLNSNAGLSAMPFFCMWIFTMGLSKILAIMHDRNWISVTVSRKVGTLISSLVPMMTLLGVSYVGCNRIMAVILMTIGVTCIGGMYCGFLANHIDIAPNYAGTLVALTNTFATIPGFVVPIFVGKLTHGNQTIEAWRVIFFCTVGLYIIEIFVYSMFGTGEEQPWNKIKSTPVEDEENPDEEQIPLKDNSSNK